MKIKRTFQKYKNSVNLRKLKIDFYIWFFGMLFGFIPYLLNLLFVQGYDISFDSCFGNYDICYAAISSSMVLFLEVIVSKVENSYVRKHVGIFVFFFVFEMLTLFIVSIMDVLNQDVSFIAKFDGMLTLQRFNRITFFIISAISVGVILTHPLLETQK